MTSVVDDPPRPRVLRRRGTTADLPAPAVELADGSADRRVEVLRIVGQGLILLGLFVLAFAVYLVGVTALLQGRDQTGLDRRFRDYLANQQAWIGGDIPEGEPIAQIVIPSLGVREIVVEGTSGGELRKGPGHLRTSGLPGQAGNSVIAGRRLSYGAPFRHLDDLQRGDVIVTTTGQGVRRYWVTDVSEVGNDDDDVLDPTRDDRLTLITSTPLLKADHRLVVTAELRSTPLPTVAPRPDELRTDELGLHSDRSGGFGLMLWLEALAAAALATVLLRRRLSRSSTYLIAAPVIMLLGLLVFDTFTPFLPSTL